jgi:hypothetical protein
MRISVKLTIITLLSVILVGCDPVLDLPHPSDDSLIRNFQSHEADFDVLAQMSQQDPNLIRIAPDFTWTDKSAAWPRPESELGFSNQRWDEYRSLFRKLDLKSGILNYQPDLILFLASTKGLVTGGSSKGYAYSVKEPPLIVESLDDYSFKDSKKDINIVYRKLKGNWYLFYEVSG